MRRILLALAVAAVAVLQPCVSRADDQQVAQEIAQRLTTSGKLQHFSIGVKYKDGTAWLSGHVADERQVADAMQIAKQSPGVRKVVNKLQINPVTNAAGASQRRTAGDVQPASATAELETTLEAAPNALPAHAGPMPMHAGHPYQGAPLPMAAAGGPMPTMVPGTGQGIAPAVYDQPHMPNYAWPSYAAYPNYAALTYPRQYSPTAWPFIGPFYPYPQVPLGWRKVTLEWDDGWWFLDFKDR